MPHPPRKIAGVCESGSSRFQPGEGPSRGLLRDYEPSDAIRMQLFEALQVTLGAEAERKDEILRVFSSGCFKHFSMNSLPFDCKFPIAEEPSSLFIQTLKFCDSEVSSSNHDHLNFLLSLIKHQIKLYFSSCLPPIFCRSLETSLVSRLLV